MRRLGIGKTANEGSPVIKEQDRFRHLYCLGKTRSGKSTFLLNLITQEFDHTCIVLDPVGSFASAVVSLAPKDRLIIVDKHHPLVINPLDRKGLSWAEQAKEFTEVMNACVTASTSTLESTVLMGEIILNAFRVLKDDQRNIEYLSEFLNYEQVRKRHLPDKYWEFFDEKVGRFHVNKEKVDSAKRVAARLSAFYVDPNLKRFTIGKNQFDVLDIVTNHKVVVVNLHGFDDGSKIYLGNLITHAVKSYYQHQATENSLPLYLYVDEFHSFLTPFFNEMLAQSAKYNISVNLAHQSHSQISKATLNAILGNCYTKVVFSCGFEEAERMANEYSLRTKDFMDLGKYEAYIAIGKKPHKVKTYPPPELPQISAPYFLSNDWIDVSLYN